MAEAADPPAPITHTRVLKIAVPIVLSNATVPILGAVDTFVVGQMGSAQPIAAVGLGAVILSSIYWIFGFLRMGTTGLVGQAEGAGDRAEVSALLTRALIIAGGGGLALIALQWALFPLAFALSEASGEAEALTASYLAIRIWSAPAAIAVFALTGWLIAMEKTAAVFIVQFVMNGINILLDLWFVLGLGWGVEGVAIATVIAEVSGAALGLWYCRDAFAQPAWRDWSRVFDRVQLLRMGRLNSDILIRSALLLGIFTSFTFLSTRFGDVTLAANHVLLQFLSITSYALDGFAFAAETLVARAVGRRDAGRLRRSAVIASQWGLAASAVMAAAFWMAGPWIIAAIAKDVSVQAAGQVFLPWMVAAPLLALPAFMLDGIFVGATRSADMRNMMAVSFAVYVLAVLALMPIFGNHGFWAALLISCVARGVTLGWRYPALERGVG